MDKKIVGPFWTQWLPEGVESMVTWELNHIQIGLKPNRLMWFVKLK